MSAGVRTSFSLNGTQQQCVHPTEWTAAVLLREGCDIASVRVACDAGVCGACSVLIDGEPYAACSMFGWQLDGRTVETAEHLVEGDAPFAAVIERLTTTDAFQCGFCAPGIVVTLAARARQGVSGRSREALADNVCRCTGYVPLLDALEPLVPSQTQPPEHI